MAGLAFIQRGFAWIVTDRRKTSLVLADVDGTLLTEQKVLTERAQAAVERALELIRSSWPLPVGWLPVLTRLRWRYAGSPYEVGRPGYLVRPSGRSKRSDLIALKQPCSARETAASHS